MRTRGGGSFLRSVWELSLWAIGPIQTNRRVASSVSHIPPSCVPLCSPLDMDLPAYSAPNS